MFKSIMLLVIWIYQKILSPFLPHACRFHPSCSEYFKNSIIRHGACKGVMLSLIRLVKCHPFNPGGYDPVP